MPESTAEAAAILHRDSLVWDAHSCLPLRYGTDVGVLSRHKRAATDFVSINIGMDMTPLGDIMTVLAYYRVWLGNDSERFALAGTPDSISRAKEAGKLAVAFDLEGAVPLGGQFGMLDFFYNYGVRQMHLIYNRTNEVGGGCHDDDPGLSAYGRSLVAKLNETGITVDCSHAGERTSLDIMAASTRPVVFSHANVRALTDHPRNLSDAQIDACAASGGVIGINGVDLFLGEPGAGSEAMVRHIDYIAQRVGVAHVGLGLDYSYESDSAEAVAGAPVDESYWWPPGNGYDFSAMHFAPPEVLPAVTAGLIERGYSEPDIRAVLGGNFLRVAKATWV
ncbi:MAG: membrane dipeptidase [Alphaproteobacteria bacterium]|jgi:membrane dipeptidase|nr:membrane dipeptidase [Alphaproteobacteria bacterium]